ncbi:MAG: hypothetical protein M3O25_10085 [Actinomycetota bacterium]|nr:hypothetical protein [Actinomycetota bacterium]
MAAPKRDVEQLESDAADTVVQLDELLNRPGTYFNPQLGMLVVIDDSAAIDDEVFNMEAYEGAEWVRISDDVAIDEEQRDVMLEEFQTHYHPGGGESLSETALEQGDGEHDEDEEGQEPGRED